MKEDVRWMQQVLLDNYIWLSRIGGILNIATVPEVQNELESKAEELFKVIR